MGDVFGYTISYPVPSKVIWTSIAAFLPPSKKLEKKIAIGLPWSSAPTHSNNSNSNDNEDGSLPQARLLSDDVATQQNDVVLEVASDSDPIARFGSPTNNTVTDGENNQEAAVGVSLMDLLEKGEQEMD